MKECSKSIPRRLRDSRFSTRYFVGSGIDVGGRPDPLTLYRELFPAITDVRTWDIEDGDAQLMSGVGDDAFDFLFSSHCLEHLGDPVEGLRNWFRIVRPGGHLIITVPEEDLYEQGVWPSTHNRWHRHAFTIMKSHSWCSDSRNLIDLVQKLGPAADIRKIEVIDDSYRFELPRFDQTLTPIGECAIEVVIRKRPLAEIEAGGRLPAQRQPSEEMRGYFNQYRRDQTALKQTASPDELFRDARDL